MSEGDAGPEQRSWVPFALAALVTAALVATWIGVDVATRGDAVTCATPIAARAPLLSRAGMAAQPDRRLSTLTSAVDAWGAPFGPVRAGVGFDYGQWLHLYALDDGLLAFTKNDAPLTYLADDGSARWALRPATRRIAWDASPDRLVVLDLAADQDTRLGSFDLAGDQRWCIRLRGRHRDGQPLATAFLRGGDLLVAHPGPRGLDLARIDGGTGRVRWSVPAGTAGRADFLGALDAGTVIAGGVEEYRLAQPADPAVPEGVTAYAVGDGRIRWTWPVAPGSVAHVVGVAADRVLVADRGADGSALLALDGRGRQVWRVPRSDAFEATVRGEVVLVRTTAGLDAYDAGTGRLRWRRAIPTARTYFPYGFTLDQMPSLDAMHLLMPTTTSLEVLDLATGRSVSYPLPVDGISTTYWPYQLAVNGGSIAVVTNIGGVVVPRRGDS